MVRTRNMLRRLRIVIILTISLVWIIALTAICLGTTYYVDAINGKDTNPGTINDPWKTIQKAALIMVAGDRCIVLSGNYQGDVNITTSGTASNPIVYEANGDAELNASFKINANYIRVIGFEVIAGGIFVNGDYCQILYNYVHDRTGNVGIGAYGRYGTIRGNTIVRAVECGIKVNGQNNLIENNDISHTLTHPPDHSYITDADGIRFFGTGHTFRRNYIHHIMHSENPESDPHIDGFQTWGPASNITFEQNFYESVDTSGSNQTAMVSDLDGPVNNLTFRNNIFLMNDPGYCAMSLYHVGDTPGIFIENISVVNNTFVHKNGQATGAIWMRAIRDGTVKNNIFYDYCSELVKSYVNFYADLPSENINIGNNCVYNTSGVYPSNGDYPNDLWKINPNFVDLESTDFHLQSNSPCIDKGETLSSVTNDYDGNSRPQGAGYDIGAYEYVLYNQPPVANAGPDQTVIDNDRNGSELVALDGSASSDPDGTIVSFIWTEGGTQIATGVKPTVTLSVGIHNITLTVTDNGGLTGTDTVTITVSSPPNQPPLADAGPDQTVIDNDRDGSEQVTLDGSASSDPDGAIVSFLWTEGATQIATGVKPTVTLSTGTHTITLTVTDDGGLTDTDTVTISVSSPDNQPPVANAGPDQTVIDNDRNGSEQVTLDGSASFDPDGTIVSLVWREGASQIATGVKPTVTLSTGTHIITLTVTDSGGLTGTDSVIITVSSPDNQPPVANAGPDRTVIDNDRNGSEEVALDGSGSSDPDGTIVSFVWREGATPIATGVRPTVILSVGTHNITLTVTDNGGLTNTDTVNIKVLKGHKKFGGLPTGCYNNVINPLKGEEATIVVELEEPGHIKIDLYDIRGNKIKELANEEKDPDVYEYHWDGKDDLGNGVGSGLYFVDIQAGNDRNIKKIVVVK